MIRTRDAARTSRTIALLLTSAPLLISFGVRAQTTDPEAGSPAGDVAGQPVAVLVTGVQTDYGDMVNRSAGASTYSIDDLCGASGQVGMAMGAIVDQVESSMSEAGAPISLSSIEHLPGAPSRAGIENDLRIARDEICNQPEEPPSVQPFVITYAYCRMAMATPAHAMDIHLPPGIGSGSMALADHATREIVTVSLKRDIDAVSEVVGSGWSNQVDMNATGASGTRIGYPSQQYDFRYDGGLGGGAGAVQALGNMVSVTNEGTAWMSDSVPGIDIVRSFYENLTREVQPDQGGMSFFAGLINNLVGMLSAGLPLEIDQTVSSRVLGRTMVSGRSRSVVTSVRLVDFYPQWCEQSLMPPDYAVTDVDEKISEAMSGSSGAGAPSSAEMSEAMQQYNEAMQQMTPEQRQMMESLGMGDMMPQAGGADPAAQQEGAAATRGDEAGSAMPSSEELHSDNLTQMVQNHLQALGYDPGNTSGEMTLETTIAISQFQAEKGLEVTGEVSPQLAGLLSAEVDSRRGN